MKQKLLLSGSSILEVVIALVLISIVISISLGIVSSIGRTTPSFKNLQVQSALQSVLLKTEMEKGLDSSAVMISHIRIERNILNQGEESALREIKLIAYDENHIELGHLEKLLGNE